jgi:hypothetical protein
MPIHLSSVVICQERLAAATTALKLNAMPAANQIAARLIQRWVNAPHADPATSAAGHISKAKAGAALDPEHGIRGSTPVRAKETRQNKKPGALALISITIGA